MGSPRDASRISERAQRPGSVALDGRDYRVASFQAWVSTLALIFGILGFWLALSTFRDQQAANRSQVATNDRENQRYQQRYATRVSWIDNHRLPRGAVLEIQNRSTADLKDVVLINQSESWAILVGDMPPCSTLTLYRSAAIDGHGLGAPMWIPEMASFRDPVGRWEKNQYRLQPLTSQQASHLAGLAHAFRDLGPMLIRLRSDGIVTHMLRFPEQALASGVAVDCSDG